jgi:hypothetical protein
MVALDVADHRLEGRTAAQLALDVFGHAPFLACGVDLEPAIGGCIVAAVAGVGEDAGNSHPEGVLHVGKVGG